MRRRRLPAPLLMASDGAPGLIPAIEECLPRSFRQRCLAHTMQNLQSKVPEDVSPELKARAVACYQGASPAFAPCCATTSWQPTVEICHQPWPVS